MSNIIGERRAWSGNCVEAVAAIPGWVFVMPVDPSRDPPFSVSAELWDVLPIYRAHTFWWKWSEEDQRYVAGCDEFPDMTCFGASGDEVYNGIRKLVADMDGGNV